MTVVHNDTHTHMYVADGVVKHQQKVIKSEEAQRSEARRVEVERGFGEVCS